MPELPDTITYHYQKVDPEYPVEAPVTQEQLAEMRDDETHTVEIDTEEAESLLAEINDIVQDREQEWTVTELVLGVEEFVTVDTYCRYAYDQTFGAWFGPG